MLDGFKKFILKGNVVDLAVGVVIGVAFSTMVNSLVKDIITPIIGAIGGKQNFSALAFTIHSSKFLIGDFINSIISFLLIAATIYFLVVVPMNKFMGFTKRGKSSDPVTKICPECLSTIPYKAKRCLYCTSLQTSKKS